MKGKTVDKSILGKIDSLELGNRILEWKEDLRSATWKLYADREKYTVESWKETVGDDIQIRRGKNF